MNKNFNDNYHFMLLLKQQFHLLALLQLQVNFACTFVGTLIIIDTFDNLIASNIIPSFEDLLILQGSCHQEFTHLITTLNLLTEVEPYHIKEGIKDINKAFHKWVLLPS